MSLNPNALHISSIAFLLSQSIQQDLYNSNNKNDDNGIVGEQQEEEEIFKFSYEVIDIINGLDHPDRRRILEVIINSDKGKLTWEEIRQKTGYIPENLNFNLEYLSKCGLIYHYKNIDNLRKNKDLRKNIEIGYYVLSPRANDSLEN